MPAKPPEPQGTFTLADVYFLVFRHKWKILPCALIGFGAAALLFLRTTPAYVSEAKILVRYVTDRASLNPASREENVRAPDGGGGIINSEIQIINSRDLAEDVAKAVGPERVLGHPGSGTNDYTEAADVILGGLKTDLPGKGAVIGITYEHPKPDIARSVLRVLIEKYMEKHTEIHRSLGAFEFLQTQTDRLRTQLQQTEEELRVLRTNAGVVSIEKAKLTLAEQMTAVRASILQDEAELEARASRATNITAVTTNSPVKEPSQLAGGRDLNFYRSICDNLDALRAREVEMLARFTEENPAIQGLRAQIQQLRKQKQELESMDPSLVAAPTNSSGRAADLNVPTSVIEARLTVFRGKWDRLRADAAKLDIAEGAIRDVERRKAIEEENYRAFATSLERARIDQAIDTSKLTTISVVQSASVPAPAAKRKTKQAGMIAVGGLGFGILLALLSEFVLQPTIKRPAEFRRGSLPLMLTIPVLNAHGRRRRLPWFRKPANESVTHVETLPTVSDHGHPMRPYFEALRDRLLVEFENVHTKPKLVGVTSCSHGAGSSTLAAGVAAALSETGDGNVLLVDLNFAQGSAHQFFKGKPVCGLSDVVEQGKREIGLVQENLYLASINQAESSVVPSRRIAEMMPKLRASDYDYIIFDMPPISTTSITCRIAGFMDRVLMVVESEKTHRHLVQEAHRLLQSSKANVHAVLNKHESYVPRALHPELNGTNA